MRWFLGAPPLWWCSSGGLLPSCGGSLDPSHGSGAPRMRRCHCSVTPMRRCGPGTKIRSPRKGRPPISWPLEWPLASTTVWRCHAGVKRPRLVGRTVSPGTRGFQEREDKVVRQFARCHVAPRPRVPDRYFIPHSPSGLYTPPPSSSALPAVLRMAYIRCTQCGSKALVAASQCPKCTKPFDTLDSRGQRAKLKTCRSCGIMHRVDSTCHWCGDVKSTLSIPTVSPAVLRNAAAVALMVTAAAGVWQYAPQLRDFATTSSTNASNAQPTSGETRVVVAASGTSSTTSATDGGVLASDSLGGAQPTLPADPQLGADSITWTPAVARTWVNVRSDASRGGQVVGVIKPSSRAMLGTDRAGWRQVRSPDVSGWVDPRLFEADSLRTRGE